MEVEALDLEPVLRIGDGAMPSELDRVNWGAALTVGLWALGHGVWWWVLAVLLLAGVRFGVFALLARSPLAAVLWIRYVTTAAFVLLSVGITALLSVSANRLYWDKQARRVARQSDHSVPRPAPLLAEYVRTQRTWAVWGAALVSLTHVLNLTRSGMTSATVNWYAITVVMPQAAALAGLYLYDLSRMRRRRSEQAPQPDSAPDDLDSAGK